MIQRVINCASLSLRQAAKQESQATAQALHSSMQERYALVEIKTDSFQRIEERGSVSRDESNQCPVELLSMREVAAVRPILDDVDFAAVHCFMGSRPTDL